ncbi:MAG: hypothetical protein ABJG68_09875 [Crocinitomicaceae bacterium]
MKTIKAALFTAVLTLSFVSCQKCYECQRDGIGGTDTKEVCDGPIEADDRAENLENDGYSCSLK